MRYKFLGTIFCIILIMSLPIAYSQAFGNQYAPGPFSTDPNPYSTPASYNRNGLLGGLGGATYTNPFGDSYRSSTGGYSYGQPIDLGNSIIVNIADYEPKQVRESLLDQSNTPVFFYLKGTTFGTALSPFTKDPSARDPFTGITNIPKIDAINVVINSSSESGKYILGSPRYVPPAANRYSLNNLGALVVYLKKLDNNLKLPDDNTIKLDMDAQILLNLEDSSPFGLSKQDLTLKAYPVEKEFLDNKEAHSIFSGKGYVRAISIDDNGAVIQVYNKELAPISLASVNPTASQSAGLQTRGTFRLTKNGQPQVLNFGYTGNPLQDSFQVKLEDVSTPRDRAEIEFTTNGRSFTRKINVGTFLISGSDWRLSSIEVEQKPNAITQADIPNLAAEYKWGQETQAQLGAIVQGAQIFEYTYTAVIENSFGETKKITRKGLATQNGDLPNFVKSPDETIAKAIEQQYCPYDTTTTPYTALITSGNLGFGGTDYGCEAVARYRTILDKYPRSDEAKLAMQDLADLYEKLLINNPSCEQTEAKKQVKDKQACFNFQVDMFRLASFYYDKLGLKDKLMDKLSGTAGEDYLDDIGVKIVLKKTEKITAANQGVSKLKIYYGGSEKEFYELDVNVGDLLPLTVEDYIKYIAAKQNPDKIPDNGFTYVTNYDKNKNFYAWRVENINPASVTLVLTKLKGDENTIWGKIIDWIKTPVKSLKDLVAGPTSERVTLPLKQLSQITKVYPEVNENTGRTVQRAETIQVEVANIASSREAYVTVLPGSTKGYVTSHFTVNIPVDPRPFTWTPEQLQKHINVTNSLLKKIDSLVTKMDNVVSTWKKICLGTFAFLTLKSSLLQSPARTQARKVASGIFKETCRAELLEKGVKTHADFDTTEECMNAHSSDLKYTTSQLEKGYGEANTKLKGNIADIKDLTDSNCGDFGKYRDSAEAQGVDSNSIKKNYIDCFAYSTALSDDKIKDSSYGKTLQNNFKAINTNQYISDLEEAQKYINANKGAYDKLSPDLQKAYLGNAIGVLQESRKTAEQEADKNTLRRMLITDVPDKNADQASIKATAFLAKTAAQITPVPGVTTNPQSQIDTVQMVGLNQYNKGLYDTKNDEGTLKKKLCPPNGDNCDAQINAAKKNIATDEKGRQIYVPASFIDENGKIVDQPGTNCETLHGEVKGTECKPLFFNSPIQLDQAGRATSGTYSYPPGAVESIHDTDGLALCYPVGVNGGESDADLRGNFVKVLSRYPTGDKGIKKLQLWNVGPNGKIDCGRGDDELQRTESEIDLAANSALKRKLLNRQPSGVCRKDGDPIGKNLRCIKYSADQFSNLVNPQCTDVMDPEDCKILFNACDPVMCPSSRCTLGGKVKPRNVIQSGIIGSTVLCFPNINQGIAVPVCLTGIDAGLKNVRSLLQSYKDCLEIKLNKGEDVGFCDYIRSVGVCEMMWREASGLLDISGGLIDWVSGKVSEPNGGNEYLNFHNNFNNIGDSVRVFTSEYKDTYTAQFLGQSSQEIGTQLCRNSVNGKLPNFGKLLDQLTQPENPPQFTAFFDEAPYAAPGDIAGASSPYIPYGTRELSLYKAFYHIYAGTGYYQGAYSQPQSLLGGSLPSGIQQPIVYSVYLVNRETGLQPLYMTFRDDEQQGGFQGAVKTGAYVQKSVQRVGARGYNQICVTINGQENCGFGKVDSSFGVQELADYITSKEAGRNATTAAQCTSDDASTPGASANRLAALGGASALGGVGVTGSSSVSGFGGNAFAGLTQGTSPAIGLVTSGLDRSFLSNGIVRVCAITEPTQEPGRWETAGTCGTDTNGKSLGSCWIDTSSVRIQDAGLRNEALIALRKNGNLDLGQFIDEQTSQAALAALESKKREVLDSMTNLVNSAARSNTQTVERVSVNTNGP